jgi:hypothetical protein
MSAPAQHLSRFGRQTNSQEASFYLFFVVSTYSRVPKPRYLSLDENGIEILLHRYDAKNMPRLKPSG